VSDGNEIRVVRREFPTEAARRIMTEHYAIWRALFLEKNRGYGEMHAVLGVRAQFVDIHRKVGKIQRAVWDYPPSDIGEENLREVLLDLIGHCFLMYDLLDQEQADDPQA
jgi:hypothetical protein